MEELRIDVQAVSIQKTEKKVTFCSEAKQDDAKKPKPKPPLNARHERAQRHMDAICKNKQDAMCAMKEEFKEKERVASLAQHPDIG